MTTFTRSFELALIAVIACQPHHPTFDQGLAFFRENRIDEARSVFEQLARSDSAGALVVTYLAETYRRSGDPERAVLTARRALAIDPCLSFAHVVIGEATIPLARAWSGTDADTAWLHLCAAAACDTSDAHPWLVLWGEAIRRNDRERQALGVQRMMQSGFFAPALLNYNRWVLAGLPPGAILLTNGDLDTYPIAALQGVEGVRTDVVLVNRGTLNVAWYARYLRDAKGLSLPLTDEELDRFGEEGGAPDGGLSDRIIQGWIRMWRDGRMAHPVTFASTIEEREIAKARDPLQFAGAFTAVLRSANQVPDTVTIERALSRFAPEDFFGPWVSDQDRSPVRRVGTKYVVRNVTHAALTLAEQAALRGDESEFRRWLRYARTLDDGSDLGPVFREGIRQLESKGVLGRR